MSDEGILGEETDLESDLAKDVFANFGLAVYLSQVTEEALTSLLVAQCLTHPPSVTRAEVRVLEDRARRSTFGQLLELVRRGGHLDAQLTQDLATAKEHRNALSHGYFAMRAAEFCLVEGCKRMLRDLQRFQEHFRVVNEQIHRLVARLSASHGVTEEMFQAEAREMLRETAARSGG